MKKLALIMAGLLLVGGAANAQDKEAIKAAKAAQKAAESAMKKAKSTYELSIANPNYGRKETDFTKLEGARTLINEAIASEYTKNNPQTWYTAADIELEYYKKYEAESKADESVAPMYIESSSRLLSYCVTADSLASISTMKPEEYKLNHIKYQPIGVNAAIQVLMAAQNLSNSEVEKQDELKNGAKYAKKFNQAINNSSLFKDFTNENLEDWKAYGKVFYAQSVNNINGTPEKDVVEAYEALIGTKYESVAYQTLASFYREKNKAKQNEYLMKGLQFLRGKEDGKALGSNFAMMLMQNYFQDKQYDDFKKIAEIIKTDFSDSEYCINAYLYEGQMEFENGNYDKAKEVFLTVNEKFPDEPKGLLMAARCVWMKANSTGQKKADMDEAISLFKQLETANPSDSDLWGEPLYILYNNTNQPKLAANYKKYYKAQ